MIDVHTLARLCRVKLPGSNTAHVRIKSAAACLRAPEPPSGLQHGPKPDKLQRLHAEDSFNIQDYQGLFQHAWFVET